MPVSVACPAAQCVQHIAYGLVTTAVSDSGSWPDWCSPLACGSLARCEPPTRPEGGVWALPVHARLASGALRHSVHVLDEGSRALELQILRRFGDLHTARAGVPCRNRPESAGGKRVLVMEDQGAAGTARAVVLEGAVLMNQQRTRTSRPRGKLPIRTNQHPQRCLLGFAAESQRRCSRRNRPPTASRPSGRFTALLIFSPALGVASHPRPPIGHRDTSSVMTSVFL